MFHPYKFLLCRTSSAAIVIINLPHIIRLKSAVIVNIMIYANHYQYHVFVFTIVVEVVKSH